MIIAVSDLHLGDPLSNREGFIHFIDDFLRPKSDDITHLVLLGDILDLWKRDSSTVVLNNSDIFNNISALGFQVSYVVGNHDFIMNEYALCRSEPNTQDFTSDIPANINVCKGFQIGNGGISFRFIHGHQINYWYALPFYETFSRAMCDTDEQVSERADVWNLIDRIPDILPVIQSNINNLPRNIQIQIASKLAGPLEGHTISMEESVILESNLLSSIMQLSHSEDIDRQKRLFNEIDKSFQELVRSNNRAMYIESLANLSEIAQDSTLAEVAENFLLVWKDVFKWIISKTGKEWTREKQQLVQYTRRIAAMFTTELQHNEFLIHGHGHNAFVNQETRTADTGCWLGEKGSFVSIDDGKVTCMPWSIM